MRSMTYRILSFVLAAGLVLAMVGCSSGGDKGEGQPIQKGDYETTPGSPGQPK